MGDESKMTGLGLWAWDAKAKKYRTWMFDNYGYRDSATATYDEDTRTWHFKSNGRNLLTGETYVSEGTCKVVDDNTQDWSWTAWDAWKLRKHMEAKGTSRRK